MDGRARPRCPLCCGETFATRAALREHLAALRDAAAFACYECARPFASAGRLSEHLAGECADDPDAPDAAEAARSPAPEELITGDDDYNSSILAKALLGPDAEKAPEAEAGPKEAPPEQECFYCSSCAISFTSVKDHLEEYHEGQAVYIEADNEDQQPEGEKSFLVVQNNKEANEDDSETEMEEDDSHEDLLNTLQQEDLVDKDGRAYTRKVVQIEKFWSEESDGRRPHDPPITQKYILDDDKTSDKPDGDADKPILSIYQCGSCQLNFSKLDQYYKHKCNLKSTASSGKEIAGDELKCTKCDMTFQTIRSLSTHLKTHKTEKIEQSEQFVCELCSTEFPTFKSLRLHSRMHDPIKVKEIEPPAHYGLLGENDEDKEKQLGVRVMFVCRICNKTYDKEYEEVHMKSHNEEQNFNCDICNRKFYTESNLEMHMRVHSNGKKFTCSYCKKGFLSCENLQSHIKHLCQSRPYECQYCGRRFMRPHEKVKHERIHTGEKPHVCEICGKAFRVSYCLTLHMRTHSGARPYKCNHCGKRFKAHSVYNHHLLTHSTARNYKCPYCPKAFKTGVQLAGHKNSHIKPFTCNECNRPFASLYAVRAHMETHKRENNLKFSCCLCGASYARSFALRDHIKEHHAEEKIEVFEMDKELTDGDAEYEMVAEGLNASNMILKDEEATNDVLVVLDENMDGVEMVEEVAA